MMMRIAQRLHLKGRSSVAASLFLAMVCGPAEGVSDGQSTSPYLSATLAPSPDLTPARVVQIQLQALRNNDAGDRGIAVAFRFASPANRASTGPLPRFIRMIKNGPYRLMLHFDHAAYEAVEVSGRSARLRVTLVAGAAVETYVFFLSRQTAGTCTDCWMTDAVVVSPERRQAA